MAVATRSTSLAAGPVVPWAKPGVRADATQADANPGSRDGIARIDPVALAELRRR